LWYFFAGDVYQPKGYLLLEGNSKGGSLYIDKNLAPGFNYNVPYPVSTGTHEISVIRDGYVTTPSQQQVIIDKNDTVSVRFNFEAHASTTMGYVKILNNIDDARIYVDNNFYGNLSEREIITLKSGRHTMSLEKEGYRSDPFEQQFELPARDTIEVNFTMRTGKSADALVFEGGTKKLGLIEVRSNVKNAEIYINGEKTDYRTDYVLQKMSFGQYVISIKKQGYQSYPDERVVRVDRDNMRAVASFTLSSTSNMVTIRTKPVKGEIFINGRPAGEGEYKGSLPIGEHKISFGDIEYYNKPEDQTIMISGDGKNEFEFEYTTSLHIEITPEGISPEKLGGRILSGYVFNNSNLIADSDNGPELKSVNGFDHKVWYLGYTFQYRNPPGSDALEFEFTVPSNIDLSQPLYLKVWGYRSGTNYPIVMRGNAYYQIIVNGNTLREKILPKYSLKEIGEDHFDTFRINDYLRHGMNKIFISTTDDTSEELALWKVSIR
ncbi:MAG: PEGA domain-containing protein, partial [Calditrichaceae bacterium]